MGNKVLVNKKQIIFFLNNNAIISLTDQMRSLTNLGGREELV